MMVDCLSSCTSTGTRQSDEDREGRVKMPPVVGSKKRLDGYGETKSEVSDAKSDSPFPQKFGRSPEGTKVHR